MKGTQRKASVRGQGPPVKGEAGAGERQQGQACKGSDNGRVMNILCFPQTPRS
jgi:hypothetical protein